MFVWNPFSPLVPKTVSFVQDYHSLHSVNIHYPPNQYVDDATRKSVIADIPGLRLAKSITLVRNVDSGNAPVMFAYQTNRLNLRLHNKVILSPN